jgi:hypothetical protein
MRHKGRKGTESGIQHKLVIRPLGMGTHFVSELLPGPAVGELLLTLLGYSR